MYINLAHNYSLYPQLHVYLIGNYIYYWSLGDYLKFEGDDHPDIKSVITHNKVTMELARQLLGVTMQEAGVSRMVSVDIDEAVQMVAN